MWLFFKYSKVLKELKFKVSVIHCLVKASRKAPEHPHGLMGLNYVFSYYNFNNFSISDTSSDHLISSLIERECGDFHHCSF